MGIFMGYVSLPEGKANSTFQAEMWMKVELVKKNDQFYSDHTLQNFNSRNLKMMVFCSKGISSSRTPWQIFGIVPYTQTAPLNLVGL